MKRASALVSKISNVAEDIPVVVLPADTFISYVSKYPACATAASVATTYCCCGLSNTNASISSEFAGVT
jgi:hypothetical protein